jgi:NAD(P)-dependent dehydrogenase (short-subunit alcohol dehydrogenase family)
MRLKDKVALVTGGGSGIGRAICERFAAEYACVTATEIDGESRLDTVSRIRRLGGKPEFVRTEIRDEQSIQDSVAKTVSAFGKLNVLVNNAAAFVIRDVNASAEEWEAMLNTNIRGTAFCVKHALPEIRKAGRGAIVNIGSISSVLGQSSMVTYNATKGAILTMTKCLALDLGSDNIRVNCLRPDNIKTPALTDHITSQGKTYEEIAFSLRTHFGRRHQAPLHAYAAESSAGIWIDRRKYLPRSDVHEPIVRLPSHARA